MVALAYGIPFRKTRTIPNPNSYSPQRILILNGAHVGDTVITTSILPILRSAYPKAEIGYVTGSWASMVLRNHQELSHLHIVDHWWHNRSRESRWRKYQRYRGTRKQALREIRDANYDLALCVYPYFLPDFMDLAWAARIPVRLGFSVSLFASLATATVDVPNNFFLHQSAIQAEVLKPLQLDPEHMDQRRGVLPESSEKAIQEVCALLGVRDLESNPYRIIHMGCGDPKREKSLEFWKELAASQAAEATVVFTGQGEREESNIKAAIDGLQNCINACNRLSWDGFVAAVRHAERLYGVESMAGHLAAAVGTPCVVVYSGAAGVARWRPEGPAAIVMTNHLPCAPCQLPWGCETMDCIRKVTAQNVIQIQIGPLQ
jgi:ADP-heptose:LPS heptosyltransferase